MVAAPGDVADYMQRRAGCNHWGGEDPYDAARRAEIHAAMTELRCSHVDADEKALRTKCATSPAAISAIDFVKDYY